ncbi:hypothetical protein D0Z06_19930 [Geodermatophilus marinus]|nr:hypothetical protein D0Z06_19930 [Geodermatophilus sp. LHW52908]
MGPLQRVDDVVVGTLEDPLPATARTLAAAPSRSRPEPARGGEEGGRAAGRSWPPPGSRPEPARGGEEGVLLQAARWAV